MKCFYHDDMDGRASAFCVHMWVGLHDVQSDSEFIPVSDYSKPLPLEKINKDEQVWIVDFSFPPESMLELLKITSDVTWIDHHKTSIDKAASYPELMTLRGIRKDGIAACVLTYQYIHWYTGRGDGLINLDVSDEKKKIYNVPLAIELVGDRDIWAFKHGDLTKKFHMSALARDTSPGSSFWRDCLDRELDPSFGPGNAAGKKQGDEFFNKLIAEAEPINRYREHMFQDYRNSMAFEVEFEGYKCLSMNVARTGSEAFGDGINKYDILLPFYFNGKEFIVSLYSKKVDVSVIAKKYGGGGHKGASGFQCKEIPFLK